MSKTILLWDIDGTLISARGSGSAALCDSLALSFGIKSDLAHIELAGRTDRWIFERILESFELPKTEDNYAKLEKHYLESLEPQLKKRGVEILPGIQQIVQEAHERTDVVQGLLTGNLVEGAKKKLRETRLWEFFGFGAFADDAANRNLLGPKALARAQEQTGQAHLLERVWVIGDTPHDITCGKIFGARTLAIATGKHSVHQLREGQPCAVFQDLSDTKAFWNTVLN